MFEQAVRLVVGVNLGRQIQLFWRHCLEQSLCTWWISFSQGGSHLASKSIALLTESRVVIKLHMLMTESRFVIKLHTLLLLFSAQMYIEDFCNTNSENICKVFCFVFGVNTYKFMFIYVWKQISKWSNKTKKPFALVCSVLADQFLIIYEFTTTAIITWVSLTLPLHILQNHNCIMQTVFIIIVFSFSIYQNSAAVGLPNGEPCFFVLVQRIYSRYKIAI